jgi:hypothetical protein
MLELPRIEARHDGAFSLDGSFVVDCEVTP